MAATCDLLDSWGIWVQFLLGLLAFSSLLVKRWTEKPKRPLLIWFFDTSKQGFANTFIHFVNVFASDWQSVTTSDNDPCTWYFINLLVDSTIGLAIIFVLLKWSTRYIRRRKWLTLYPGRYGSPPSWKVWAAQVTHYMAVVMIEKALVLIIMLLPFWAQLGEAILRAMRTISPKVEALGAMLIMPFVITVVWFWVVDNMLMAAENIQVSEDDFDDLEGSIRMVQFEANTSGSEDEWLDSTADTTTLLRQR
eukprot:TRINITY_DN8242_c0_g1_i2.p1 TRINITY_DN8242_c0_g1~~TRINITY_DN8242_c0_g1_i2.p1  ORF type:complete len:250 (+),score=29.71 TRINITY_DN8242_c0_g1_i2:110-859(+)